MKTSFRAWGTVRTANGRMLWSEQLRDDDEPPGVDNCGVRIIWLAVWCLAYPLYTAGLSSRSLGLFGNVATIALSSLRRRYGVASARAPRSSHSARVTAPRKRRLLVRTPSHLVLNVIGQERVASSGGRGRWSSSTSDRPHEAR